MIFGLEQEGGSLMAPMALAHALHPIGYRSRNKRRNLWVGCVSSWWPLFPPRSSVLIYIYIFIYTYIYTYTYIHIPIPIRMHSLIEFCYIGRIYTHTRSVAQHWWSCSPSFFFFFFFGGGGGGGYSVHGLNATFCFLSFTNCVLPYGK